MLLGFVDPEASPRFPGSPRPKYTLEQLDGVFSALQSALSRVRVEQVRLAKMQHTHAEAELAKLQEAKACAVCLDRERSTVLLPCGHVVLCSECARSGDIVDCPICRAHIDRVMDVFL